LYTSGLEEPVHGQVKYHGFRMKKLFLTVHILQKIINFEARVFRDSRSYLKPTEMRLP